MAKRREEEIAKIRVPKSGEILGVAEVMLGGDKVQVRCEDGRTRICRIPGKIRKRMWVRPGYLLLIQPWVAESETRGDILFVYTRTQAAWLKRKGYVETIELE